MSDPNEWRANIQGLIFSRIFVLQATGLELSYKTKEVLVALRDINGDKALGSDGFTIAFW